MTPAQPLLRHAPEKLYNNFVNPPFESDSEGIFQPVESPFQMWFAKV